METKRPSRTRIVSCSAPADGAAIECMARAMVREAAACALLLRRWEHALERVGIEIAGDEIRVSDDALVQRNCRLDSLDDKLVERAMHSGNRFGAVVAIGNRK